MANIIFDLDGTLWSTVATAVKAWNEALDQQGLSSHHISVEQMMTKVGMPRNEMLAEFFPTFSEDQMSIMTKSSATLSFKKIKELGGTIYPEVLSTLEELKSRGHQLFIVSNCQIGYIDLFLNQTKTHSYFSDQECWGKTLQEKSENIKLLMIRNNIDEAYYVGDTQGDLIASNGAGATFIQANYGFGNMTKKEPLSIDRFNEILAYF